MKNLSSLEKVLVKKEISFLNGEIAKALKIIRAAFDVYANLKENDSYTSSDNKMINITKDNLEELHKYVNEIKLFSSFYYAGDYLAFQGGSISEVNPPQFIVNLMLVKSANELLEKIDSIEEIKNQMV